MRVPGALLSEERAERFAAARDLELDQDGIFALRNVLLTDEDAELRGVAAERLGLVDAQRARGPVAVAARVALLEATSDPSPYVRERATASLARHLEEEADPRVTPLARARLEEMIRLEPIWRVRRTAARALAQIARELAIPALSEALDDPFWRVRHAAIQALAEWPKSEPLLREAPATPRRAAALVYLAQLWRGEQVPLDPPEPARVSDDPLEDEDPAVVAARLARASDAEVRGEELVRMLRSPHDVLRRLAIKRLLRRNDERELTLAARELDEPRVPYVTEAARALLAQADMGGVRAAILDDPAAGAGSLAWAIETEETDSARFMRHPDARVRRAAALWLTEREDLLAGLRDEDEIVRAICVDALGDAPLDPRTEPPRVSRLLADDPRALESWDPATRALALQHTEAPELAEDPDPWIRGAALDAARAARALEHDPDPGVRRRAFELCKDAALGARSDDAWIRARAAHLLELEPLLRLTRDPAPMVRSAAVSALPQDTLEACFEIVEREPPPDDELRLAAHAQLVQTQSQRAYDALERDIARGLSQGAHFALLGMTLAYPEEMRADAEVVFEPRPRVVPSDARAQRAPAKVARRALGKTGIEIAPLVLSGAFDLPRASLERAREAGVSAFFWEPDYRALTEHLARAPKKDELVIIAGSYEADAKTIERDVDRALRRLGIDALGVMLLFWVRSRARLSDEAYECLARLKEKGKIRAMGFSTHLREVAAEAIRARAWDVVMCRHSAAHTGVERELLPVARERGVGVLAFSALVYGRMLKGSSALECYRYVLAQPGVSAVISAPRRQRELEENLGVLRAPPLDEASIARLRTWGERVREENRAFQQLVRGK